MTPEIRDVAVETITMIGLCIVAFLQWKTYHNTNSMKDALVALTRKDAHEEGVEEGIQQEKDRTKKP